MQNNRMIEFAKTVIRAQICTTCYQRPSGSEKLGPMIPRQCERQCTIFSSLPELAASAMSFPRLDPDALIRKAVCQTCKASLSAGDYCAEHFTRVCPLSRYAIHVVQILDGLQIQKSEK